MKRRRWILASGVIAWATFSVLADTVDFSRYEVILTRKPFGQQPAGPVVPGPTSDEIKQKTFIKDLRMCAVTLDDTGALVGIVNVANNKSYLWRIGDSEDDINLVDANYEEEKALLRKGDEEYWLYMSGEAAGATSPPGVTNSPGPVSAFGGMRKRPAVMPSAGGEPRRESYVERLRKRRESVRVLTNEPPRLTGEELEKHMQEYQMELIRAAARGESMGPPLPIPLTPEMDQQLVNEGVLPSQE